MLARPRIETDISGVGKGAQDTDLTVDDFAMKESMPKMEGERIRASFDSEGIYVYQAFESRIAQKAVELGTFGEGFGLSRMTWIKPSLGWMMYRSGYADKPNQEHVLRIKMTHEGFDELLSQAALASFNPSVHDSYATWEASLQKFDARVQWDPDRDLALNEIEGRRAIQIGVSASLVKKYVNEWIIGIEDVTELVHGLGKAAADLKPGEQLVHPFPEKVYLASKDSAIRLGIAGDAVREN